MFYNAYTLVFLLSFLLSAGWLMIYFCNREIKFCLENVSLLNHGDLFFFLYACLLPPFLCALFQENVLIVGFYL